MESLYKAIEKINEGNYGSAKNFIEKYINTFTIPTKDDIVQWSNSIDDTKNGKTAVGSRIAVQERCNGAMYVIQKIKSL